MIHSYHVIQCIQLNHGSEGSIIQLQLQGALYTHTLNNLKILHPLIKSSIQSLEIEVIIIPQ